jgi:hypothetical protein
MRRLTFRGYLESYVQLLAGQRTLALPRLAALARSEPRLTEPLVLWAVATGNASRLSRLLQAQGDLERELATLVSLQQQGTLESALAAEDHRLRPEYTKVWRSYVVRRDACARDAQLKLEARNRVLALEKSKRVSRYRMAKDLGLNPGNLHAFLAQGDPTKLSLDRALGLVRYLEAA